MVVELFGYWVGFVVVVVLVVFLSRRCLGFSYPAASSTVAWLETLPGFELLKRDCERILSVILIGYIGRVPLQSFVCFADLIRNN